MLLYECLKLLKHICNELLINDGFIEEIDIYVKNIYNTDLEYIYDYIQINNIINYKNKIIFILNHILNYYGNQYKIINDTYIITN